MTAGRRAVWRSRVLAHLVGSGGAVELGPTAAAADAGGPVPAAGAAPRLGERPRVLLVRPDHLGDVLFTGPAVARLRSGLAAAEITLLVGPWARPIAERLPGVDHVLDLDFPWFDRRPKGAPWRPYLRLLRAARVLRAGGAYDAVVVLRDDDYWSAALVARAGVPVRAGHDDARVRPLVTHVLPGARRPVHAAAAGIALVAALVTALVGGESDPPSPDRDPLALTLRPDDAARADEILAAEGLSRTARPPVAIHPGSGSPVKRWRPEAWADVLAAVTVAGETVVLTGGPDERPLAAAVSTACGRQVVDLAGRTDLGTLAAVFARCRLVIGPDSGPLHLAVAAGTPTVHLFGPAASARFGPWGAASRHRVVASWLPCAPCGRLDWRDPEHHPCVRVIPVADVIRAAPPCDPPGANL